MTEAITRVETTGIELCYETFGSSGDPPVLLVMGLGTQMIAWSEPFCEELAARGLYVIRFDNRDVGRSTHLRSAGSPDPVRLLLGRSRAPYSLDEMAADAVGLLDVLGLGSAHVVGASMGGFIAQLMAINAPERVRSLVLIMTSTGSRTVGRPSARVLRGMLRRRNPQADRDTAVETILEVYRTIGSPAYPFDEERIRDLAGRGYDRCYDPSGYLRQVAAILTQRDRTKALASVAVPTTVVHGLADPLVAVSGGRAIARAVPQARFVGIAGMGHDLPRQLWSRIGDEIDSTVAAGESARSRSEALG